jgi:hypothetical protein
MSLIQALGSSLRGFGSQPPRVRTDLADLGPSAAPLTTVANKDAGGTSVEVERLQRSLRSEIQAAFASSETVEGAHTRLTQTLPSLLQEYGLSTEQAEAVRGLIDKVFSAARSPEEARGQLLAMFEKLACKALQPAAATPQPQLGQMIDVKA